MKLQDSATQSIAEAAREVLEGYGKKKMKKEEVKYPHMMYDPKTGKGVEAKTKEEHEALAKKGYTHEKPKMDEVAEPVSKTGKKIKADHKVKVSGEDDDGDIKEAKHDDEDEVDEESSKQKKYQAFFDKALKKFGVKSPAELKGDKKKEFFDYVDKNYEADNESD